MSKDYCVYVHTNKKNGEKYVGCTCKSVEKRWGTHGNGYQTGKLKAAIEEYGWDNFDHEIIEEGLDLQEALKTEAYYISYYDTINYGYNTREKDSPNCYEYSEEVKAKISKANTGKPGPWKGKKMPKSACEKMSRSNKGKHSGPNNYWYGKHHTEEQKEAYRQSHLGKKLSEEHKAKISKSCKGKNAKRIINTLTGIIYPSVEECCLAEGLSNMDTFKERVTNAHNKNLTKSKYFKFNYL